MPTCTVDGVRTYTCKYCGDVYVRYLDAYGHKWDGGVVTDEATYLHDGETTYTCTRCGETRTEAIEAASLFFGLFNPEDGYAGFAPPGFGDTLGGLHITLQPEGGTIRRDSGDTHVMTIAAEGGTGAYTYQWFYRETLIDGMLSGMDEYLASTLEGVSLMLSGKTSKVSDAFHEATGLSGALVGTGSVVCKPVDSTSSGFTAVSFDEITSHEIPGATSPTYTATEGGREYWCVVTDEDGTIVASKAASVTWRIRIATEPRDININDPDGSWAVFAVDGATPYEYHWFGVLSDGTEEAIEGYGADTATLSSEVSASYQTVRCMVIDHDGYSVVTRDAGLYDAAPLKVYGDCFSGWTILPGQSVVLTAWATGGVLPYTATWTRKGELVGEVQTADAQPGQFTCTVSETGTYKLTIIDAMGETVTGECLLAEQQLAISRQPEGGMLSAPTKGKGGEHVNGTYTFFIEMGEGTMPFTYKLYWNDAPLESQTSGQFTVNIPGEYYIHVEDATGRWADSDVIVVEDYDFRFADVPDEVFMEDPYEGIRFSISVAGGLAPYTYEWFYWDSTDLDDFTYDPVPDSKRVSYSESSSIRSNSIGYYRCEVTDANGVMIRTTPIFLGYIGSKPFIYRQPEDMIISSSSTEPLGASIWAIATPGVNLQYDWWHYLMRSSTGWMYKWTKTDVRGSEWTQGGSGRNLMGEFYCTVTNPDTGESTDSRRFILGTELVLVRAEQIGTTRDIAYEFEGGVGPYMVVVAYGAYILDDDGSIKGAALKEDGAYFITTGTGSAMPDRHVTSYREDETGISFILHDVERYTKRDGKYCPYWYKVMIYDQIGQSIKYEIIMTWD